MTTHLARDTRDKLAKIYAAGIAVFIGIFGFVTAFAVFVSHLK
ncbi:MAG: hypothetical protein V9G29_18895 [Burkholderiaceae bacterium]|jgi:hypothetical protein|nr:hypothetical protein [Burkholderiaceae bacterium]